MEPRLDAYKRVPGALPAMRGLENLVRESGLEAPLLELVRIRASQMNGCAYCLDMHSKDARAAGETEQRLDTLSAWRETAFFTDRERAALEWTESVTDVAHAHVPDATYERVRKLFTEAELVNLTMAIVAINGWNRLNIAFRTVPGRYQPSAPREADARAKAKGTPAGRSPQTEATH